MTWDEWQALGETKHHEWSEGVLYVNPPNSWHVLATMTLARRLDDACPPGLRAFQEWGLRAPLGDFEPDIMVTGASQPATAHYATDVPLLVVEVGSPTTRDLDWDRKFRAYAEAGVAWYWIVDRGAITVFENVDGQFLQRQVITAGSPAQTVGPVSLLFDPDTLTER